MRKLLALIAALTAVPAGAVDLGLRLGSGNEGYKGANAYAVLPLGDLSVRPAFDSVETDATGEAFKNVSMRLGYDTAVLGIGVIAATTPKTDGYKNVAVGGDVTATLSATGGGARRIRTSGGGAPRGKGLARVDVGAGVLLTQHEDELNASGAARASARKIAQRDVSLFVGASFIGFNVSANLTNSSYDKKPGAADRAAPRLAVEGLNTRLAGFPETSLTLHAEAPFLPLINPFVSYNTTRFEGSSLTSKTVGVGGYLGLEMLEVYAALERTDFNSSAAKDLTTVTLGASLRFGLGG